MTLATHAVAGASAAIIFRRYPLLGLLAAFFSHFLLDSIPHWHYSIPLKVDGKWRSERFAWDMAGRDTFARTGADAILGALISLALALRVAPEHWFLALLGAGLGVLPDLMQFLNYLTKMRLLVFFQNFHKLCHAKLRLDGHFLPGLGIETAFSLGAIVLALAIK